MPGNLIALVHQGYFIVDIYSFKAITLSPDIGLTGIEYNSNAKGLEAKISGKSVMFSASRSLFAVILPNPSIAAALAKLLLEFLTDSGAKVTVTVYSLGMLKININPSSIAAIPTLRNNIFLVQSFWISSTKFISTASGSFSLA